MQSNSGTQQSAHGFDRPVLSTMHLYLAIRHDDDNNNNNNNNNNNIGNQTARTKTDQAKKGEHTCIQRRSMDGAAPQLINSHANHPSTNRSIRCNDNKYIHYTVLRMVHVRTYD